MTRKLLVVNDRMQSDYRYELVAPIGRSFGVGFKSQLTPRWLLAMGVFGGMYMTDCRNEFPPEWYVSAKLSLERYDPAINYFGIPASKPLSYWREKV
jgi:hypothetical protein